MSENLVTKQDLDQFRKEILSDFLSIFKSESSYQGKILRSRDVMKLLGISENMLYKMRCSKSIPFKKFGRLTFYKLEDIQAILDDQTNSIRNNNFKGNRFNVSENKFKING